MQLIYYENSIKDHPRTVEIISKLGKNATVIECDRYQEIFNLKSQNFRIQKQHPALILAKKTGQLVMPAPAGFGIGGTLNYYFSHMLNCLYDCRYCFLQGMYASAHYVLFINYEDFATEILKTIAASQGQTAYFFSGYDGDSLAFDPISQFTQFFVPFFANNPRAVLELRTKSLQIQALLNQSPADNVIVAFSLTPAAISQKIEHGVPPLNKRLQAMKKLAEAGWKIGLRFDPLLQANNFSDLYRELIEDIFNHIHRDQVHSVSIGALRFPQKMFQKIVKLYPREKMLIQPLIKRAGIISYEPSQEETMKAIVMDHLNHFIKPEILFECTA